MGTERSEVMGQRPMVACAAAHSRPYRLFPACYRSRCRPRKNDSIPLYLDTYPPQMSVSVQQRNNGILRGVGLRRRGDRLSFFVSALRVR
jgi:hypothetical protein